MKNSQKGAIPLTIILISVLVGGAIFFYLGTRNNKALEIQNLQNSLSEAQVNMEAEIDKLDDLKRTFRSTYPEYGTVQNQCVKMVNVARSLDVLFETPSTDPKIKVNTKTSQIEADINSKRANINEILKNCPDKTASALKKDAETIESFKNNLFTIIEALTPENSGLSQEEINIYLSAVNDAVGKEINGVIESLTQASGADDEHITLTSEQIQIQEEMVAQAQQQVEEIKSQLEEIQTGGSSGSTTEETSPSSSSSSGETAVEESSDGIIYFSGGQIPEGQGIEEQEGPPELIQGSNSF